MAVTVTSADDPLHASRGMIVSTDITSVSFTPKLEIALPLEIHSVDESPL